MPPQKRTPAKKATAKRAPAAKKATAAAASAPAKKAAPRKATRPQVRLRRGAGQTERMTFAELRELGLLSSTAAVTAIAMAKHVDGAPSAAGAAAASRELRMLMATARALGNPFSPGRPRDPQADPDDPDGVVVGPNRLAQLRATASGRAR